MGRALITGASRGLGREFARQLAGRGHDLVLVARSAEGLEELAGELTGTGVATEVLVADLADAHDLERVAARVSNAEAPVGLLVNNAGFGLGRGFTAAGWAEEQAALAVMVTAVARLSHAAAGAMVPRGRGAILNVSSIAATLANSAYAAHKRWVVDFTQALAGELRGTGVTATVVMPGFVRTSFHDAEELRHMRDDYPSFTWLEPDRVVADALRGVRRRDVVVVPSLRYRTLAAAIGLVPGPLRRRALSGRRGLADADR